MDGMIPRSRSGWWTGWLIAGFAACYVVGGLISALLQGSGSSIGQPVTSAVALSGLVCMVAALVAGISALLKKDRSAPVFVAIGLGVLVAAVLIGGFIVQH